MPFPSSIAEMWAQALARNLFPLAIARGSKAPIGAGWNVWTTPMPHPQAGGVGFRCCPQDGGHSGFDSDESDPYWSQRLLAAFREVLAEMGFANCPVRWGNRPKFLIPYFLLDAPVQGRTFTYASGAKLQLIGGQYIAFGEHPITKKPYEWENWDNWQAVPRITQAQLLYILSEVPMRAGTSLKLSADHETCSPEELDEAKPLTQDEWQVGREQAQKYLGLLRQELLGRTENRGGTVFAIAGVLKYASRNTMCAREEIEQAITDSQGSLEPPTYGGRTLREELDRQELMPVLRGNLIMLAIMARRTLLAGLNSTLPATMEALTGLELKAEDNADELPWLLYQRVLAGEVHFITGHSGAGKSAVVSDMVVCYLTGRPWLDADVERSDGHVLWIAAEDAYSTERRIRFLLRNEPNFEELRKRFHLVPEVREPMALEQQCIAQVQFMASMGKRVDMIVLDTWGASGLCFADNDTESVLKAMFILKNIVRRTSAAGLIMDHLPLGNEDAWQKGNGAKSGNSGFMYRVTKGTMDQISIDCGKARGAPKAKSYVGKVVSENYGTDRKGRVDTVNVFKRSAVQAPKQLEQSAVLRLAAMLPGASAGEGAMMGGAIVTFDSVSADVGARVDGKKPDYVMTYETAEKLFSKEGVTTLRNSEHFRTVRGRKLWAVHAPTGAVRQEHILFGEIIPPTKGSFPWQQN